jgi:hypothetical protein
MSFPRSICSKNLEYIADHPKMFTKAEMAVMIREAAEELLEMRELISVYQAVG